MICPRTAQVPSTWVEPWDPVLDSWPDCSGGSLTVWHPIRGLPPSASCWDGRMSLRCVAFGTLGGSDRSLFASGSWDVIAVSHPHYQVHL